MKIKPLIIILINLLFIAGCQPDSDITTLSNINAPESGKSTIHGILLKNDKTPLDQITVRLAKVYQDEKHEGAFVLDDANSPLAVTDKNGEYYFIDLHPGEYVMFIGEISDRYEIISDDDQNPMVFSVNPNEILNIEAILIDF